MSGLAEHFRRDLIRFLVARAITCPRTMRAMVSHSTAPMATKSRMMFRPKKTMSRMTKIVKGSA